MVLYILNIRGLFVKLVEFSYNSFNNDLFAKFFLHYKRLFIPNSAAFFLQIAFLIKQLFVSLGTDRRDHGARQKYALISTHFLLI